MVFKRAVSHRRTVEGHRTLACYGEVGFCFMGFCLSISGLLGYLLPAAGALIFYGTTRTYPRVPWSEQMQRGNLPPQVFQAYRYLWTLFPASANHWCRRYGTGNPKKNPGDWKDEHSAAHLPILLQWQVVTTHQA